MININDVDLESALRLLALQSGHTISGMARALMRIGMRAKPGEITAEIVALRKPMGRPPTLTTEKPAPSPDKMQPGETPVDFMRRKKARLAAEAKAKSKH